MADDQTNYGAFVLYPREYRLSEDPAQSRVIGVTQKGVEIAVSIRPGEAAVAAARQSPGKSLPDLARFARTARSAKNPCIASPDNGPERPAGVLLVEQAFPIDRANRHWGGLWASVLRCGPDEPRPALGVGYLEIQVAKRMSEAAAGYYEHYRALTARLANGAEADPLGAEQERDRLRAAIFREQYKRFAGVLLRPAETLILPQVNREALEAALAPALERYTRRGLYGGAFIRVRRGELIDVAASAQVEMRYVAREQRQGTVDEALAEFRRFNLPGILRAAATGATVEVMPAVRVNCAPLGNQRFGAELEAIDERPSKVVKTYVDNDFQAGLLNELKARKGQRVCPIAIRVAEVPEGAGAGNLILSNIHAMQAPFANPYEVDPAGRKGYRMDRRREQAETRSAVAV